MARSRALRYGVVFGVVHFVVVAVLIVLETAYLEYPSGRLALQAHRVIDAPVWDVPRLLSPVIASPAVTRATLAMFPGPSPTPALIALELAVFGIAGGLFYFIVGVVVAWIVGIRARSR